MSFSGRGEERGKDRTTGVPQNDHSEDIAPDTTGRRLHLHPDSKRKREINLQLTADVLFSAKPAAVHYDVLPVS